MLTKFIESIRGRINRPLQYYQDICVRCGACIDACHFYVVSQDPAHIPANRMMLAKKLMQGGDGNGNLSSWYHEFQEINDPTVAQLKKALWECTGCRRCAVFCPFDLDTGLLVGMARYSLLQEFADHDIIAEIGQAEVSKGEIIDDIKGFYVDQVKVLEERLRNEFAPDLQIPVENEGARVLYVPLVGEHALVPAAKIFHAAEEEWSMSLFTATNHSFFVGDSASAKKTANWIVQEARRLDVKAIVYSECGHATRTLLQYFDTWFDGELAGIERINVVQLVASYLRQGKIRVKSGAFDVPLTYHDPCNLGRNVGIFEEPRMLINAIATDFRESTPNRELNWCCGGGGGLIADPDMFELRMRGGRPKANQIRQTGAKWVVTACENCKTQLGDLNEYYELGIEIKGIVNLIADALIL